jgi:hypothetical protein
VILFLFNWFLANKTLKSRFFVRKMKLYHPNWGTSGKNAEKGARNNPVRH